MNWAGLHWPVHEQGSFPGQLVRRVLTSVFVTGRLLVHGLAEFHGLSSSTRSVADPQQQQQQQQQQHEAAAFSQDHPKAGHACKHTLPGGHVHEGGDGQQARVEAASHAAARALGGDEAGEEREEGRVEEPIITVFQRRRPQQELAAARPDAIQVSCVRASVSSCMRAVTRTHAQSRVQVSCMPPVALHPHKQAVASLFPAQVCLAPVVAMHAPILSLF